MIKFADHFAEELSKMQTTAILEFKDKEPKEYEDIEFARNL